MIKKLDHIGVAVHNLEESLIHWQEVFGITECRIETLQERGVKVAHLIFKGGVAIELISPLGGDSTVAKFLHERGEGIHHFCFEVRNIRKAMDAFKKKGIRFVQDEPWKGTGESAVSFIHPGNLNGVLIELKEKKK